MQIIANWKQFLTPDQEVALAKEIITDPLFAQKYQITLLPSYLSLREIKKLLQRSNSPISLGAQDVGSSIVPAQTGNVRADFLDVETLLIGHSERAKYNHENFGDWQQKLNVSLQLDKHIVLCFGEDKVIANDQDLLLVLKQQLQNYRSSIPDQLLPKVTLAYEPQWSIGGTQTASQTIVIKVLALAQTFGFTTMIYGGSIDQENIKAIYSPKLAGFLVGRASTNLDSFRNLLLALDQLS